MPDYRPQVVRLRGLTRRNVVTSLCGLLSLLGLVGCRPEPVATQPAEGNSTAAQPSGAQAISAGAASSGAGPAGAASSGESASGASSSGAAAEPVTFNRHIAPIVFGQCLGCHRAGEAGPFELITYHDVQKHGQQIVEVTSSRFMPPWLPDPRAVKYRGERLLTEEQIALIKRWVEQGMVEGDPADLPPLPKFTPGWQLGEPDLVVTMPEPFKMPAGGPDVYRNFVVPIPLTEPKWVRGMELRPGNRRIVHHAFMLTDPTRATREADELDAEPGFPGMDTKNAQSPAGEFISWQPGRVPRMAEPGMSWRLNPGTDLVLQVHMQPSGKPEELQASVGLFFTDEPPTKYPYKLYLQSVEIDIPAGEANYKIRDEYVLPVAVELMAVSPHAHYLGKTMVSWAELPDGRKQWLMKIDDWDLNWQGDYVFAEPIQVPAGTKLVQEFTYDNTANNHRNPFDPPRRVAYGLEATDEMGSLWIQMLPASYQDFKTLSQDFMVKVVRDTLPRYLKKLREDPQNVMARIELGKVALVTGNMAKARELFDAAYQLDPHLDLAVYHAGHIRLRQGEWESGVELLRRAVELRPTMFNAHHDLGMAYLQKQDWPTAARYFERALEINPYHVTALSNMALVAMHLERWGQARDLLRRALSVEANDANSRKLMEQVEQRLRGN